MGELTHHALQDLQAQLKNTVDVQKTIDDLHKEEIRAMEVAETLIIQDRDECDRHDVRQAIEKHREQLSLGEKRPSWIFTLQVSMNIRDQAPEDSETVLSKASHITALKRAAHSLATSVADSSSWAFVDEAMSTREILNAGIEVLPGDSVSVAAAGTGPKVKIDPERFIVQGEFIVGRYRYKIDPRLHKFKGRCEHEGQSMVAFGNSFGQENKDYTDWECALLPGGIMGSK